MVRLPAVPRQGLALLAVAAALAGCGMPQQPEPSTPQAAAAEPPPELMGRLAEAGPTAPEPAPAASARRPGWGTMAPIPNPSEYAASNPPYRLIGPTSGDEVRYARRPTRDGRAMVRIEPAQAIAPTPSPVANSKPRIRHWIIPIRNGS